MPLERIDVVYSNRRKFGKADMETTSRKSTCALAPGDAKRYFEPLNVPATIIAVLPVYS
jgi:hypothetical protein